MTIEEKCNRYGIISLDTTAPASLAYWYTGMI